MNPLSALAVRISGDIAPLQRSLDQANRHIGGFAQKAEQSGNTLTRSFGSLQSVVGAGLVAGAAAATVLGAALTGVAVSGVKMASDLEAQMSGIAAVLNKTRGEVEPLKNLILELGIDPNLKVNAAEAASAIEMLARNGLKMEDILGGAARATVLLSNATGGDFALSADIATDVMALWNIKAADMMSAVDGITSVVTNSKFSIQDYALAIAQGGGVAASVGVDYADFNTTIAAISPLFASGSDAGTSFKVFLQSLVGKSGPAKDAMAELGLITADGSNRFFDAAGNMKSMAEIAGILNSATAGLSEAQKNQAFSTIFGTDAMRAAFGIAGLTEEQFRTLQATMGETSAMDAAKTRMDNLKGAMEILSGIVETLRIRIGEKLIPIVRQMVEAFSRFLEQNANQIVGFFEAAAAGVSALISVLPALANYLLIVVQDGDALNDWLTHLPPAIQPVVQQIGSLIARLQEMIAPIASAITRFVSWQDVLAALALVIAATVGPALVSIVTGAALVAAAAAGLVAAVATLRNAWQRDWGGVRTLVTNLVGYLVRAFGPVLTAIQTFGRGALGEIATFVRGGETQFDNLKALLKQAAAAVGQVLGDIVNYVRERLPEWIARLAEWGRKAWEWVQDAIPPLLSKLGELGSRLLGWLTEQTPKLLAKLQAWGRKFVEWVGPRIPELIRELGVLLGKMAEWIVGTAVPAVIKLMLTVGAALIGFAAWAAVEVIPKLLVFLQATENYIKNDILPAVADAAIEVGKGIVRGIGKGIEELRGWLEEKARAIAKAAIDAAKKLLGIESPSKAFAEIGAQIVAGLVKGLERHSPEAVKAVADMAKALGDAFSSLVEGITAVSAAQKLLASGKAGGLAAFTAIADWMEQAVLAFESFVKARGLGNELERAKEAMDSIVPVLNGLATTVDTLSKIIAFVAETGAMTLEGAAAKARAGAGRILAAMEAAVLVMLEALAYWEHRGLSVTVEAEAQNMLANWRDSIGVIADASAAVKTLLEAGAWAGTWAEIRQAVRTGATFVLSAMRDAIEVLFTAINYWRDHGMLIRVPAASQNMLANWGAAVNAVADATGAVKALWELGQVETTWPAFRAAVQRGATILLSSLRDAVEVLLTALNYWRDHNMLTEVSEASRVLLESWGAAVQVIASATDAVKGLWEFGQIDAKWSEIRAAVGAGTYRMLDAMRISAGIIVQVMTAWAQEQTVPQVDTAVQGVLEAWQSIVGIVAGAADGIKKLWEFGQVDAKWNEVRTMVGAATYRILDMLHAAAGIIVQTMTAWARSRALTEVDEATAAVLDGWNRIVGIVSGAIDNIKRLTDAGAWEMDTAQLAEAAQAGARKILEALMMTTESITSAFTDYLATNPEGGQIAPVLAQNAATWARIVQLVNTALSDLRSVIGGIEGPSFRAQALAGACAFGAEWVEQIIRGIRSRLPALIAVLDQVKGLFPHSPADYGPFAKPLDVSDYFVKPFQAAFGDLNATLSMPDVPVFEGGGGGTRITITGNTFSDRRDIDYMADQLVRRLRLQGVGS